VPTALNLEALDRSLNAPEVWQVKELWRIWEATAGGAEELGRALPGDSGQLSSDA
jgi:hypothetical protein